MNQTLRPGFRTKPPKIKHCHKLIADTAKAMAHALFDEMMSKDAIWSEFKRQHPGLSPTQMEDKFVRHLWPQLVEQARATLAAMLATPIAEPLKEDIMDALVRDQSLKRGRSREGDLVLGAAK